MKKLLNKTFIFALSVAMLISICIGFVFMSANTNKAIADGQPSSVVNLEDVNLTMVDGVALKISEDGGLRFRVKMDEASYNTIKSNENVKLQVIITPEAFFDKVTDGKYYQTLSVGSRAKIVEINKGTIYKDAEMYYANACLIQITADHYNLSYKAIAVVSAENASTTEYKHAMFNPEYSKGKLYDVLNSAVLDSQNNTAEIMAISRYNTWFGKGEYPIVINNDANYVNFVNKVNNDVYAFEGLTVKLTQNVDTTIAQLDLDKFKGKISQPVSVEFYNGSSYLKTITVNKGENVVYDGAIPTKASDAEYTYEFDKWVTEDGGSTSAVLNGVTADMKVYASFTPIAKARYAVTVNVNNTEYGSVDKLSFEVIEGSVISVNGNVLTVGDTVVTATSAENVAPYTYVFKEWSVSEGTVDGPITITAKFERWEKLAKPTFTVENTVVNLNYNKGGDGYVVQIKDLKGGMLEENYYRPNDYTNDIPHPVNSFDVATVLGSSMEWTVAEVSVYSYGKPSAFTTSSDKAIFYVSKDTSVLSNGTLSWTEIPNSTYDLFVNGEKQVSNATGNSVKVDTYANPANVYAVIKYSGEGYTATVTTATKLWSTYKATKVVNDFENGVNGIYDNNAKVDGNFKITEGNVAHSGSKSAKITTSNTGAYSSDWLFINFPGQATATKVTLSMWIYVESIRDKDGNNLGWSDVIYSAVGFQETSRYGVKYITTGFLQVGAWSRLDLTFVKDEGEINVYNGVVLRQNSELWYNSYGDSNENGNKSITYYIDDICLLETQDTKVNCTFSKAQIAGLSGIDYGPYLISSAVETGTGIVDGIDSSSAKMYPGAYTNNTSQYNRNDVDVGNVKDKDGNAYGKSVSSIFNIYNENNMYTFDSYYKKVDILKPRYASGNGTSAGAILSKSVVKFWVKNNANVSDIIFIVDKGDGNGFVVLDENIFTVTDEWQYIEFDCSKLGYSITRLVVGTTCGNSGWENTVLVDGFEIAIR